MDRTGTRAYLVIFTLTDDSIQIYTITGTWDQAKYYTTPVTASPHSTPDKVAMKDFHPASLWKLSSKYIFVDVTPTVDLKSSLSLSTMDYR